jgi:hypothetical protein
MRENLPLGFQEFRSRRKGDYSKSTDAIRLDSASRTR